MADTPTVKVLIGDTPQEVSLDNLTLPEGYRILAKDQAPEGYVSQQFMESELARRLKGKANPDELIGDDEFFRRAATKRGLQLGDDLKPVAKMDPKQIEALQSQWRAEHLDPIARERDAFKAEAEKGRRDVLMRDLMQAAPQVGVRKERLRSLFQGETPEFIERVASRAKWDEDRRVWYFTDPVSGNPIYADRPTTENPYAGAAKYLELLRKQDSDFLYFEDSRQRGSGFEHTTTTGSAYRLTREDAKDPAKYRAAREAAAKAGKTLEIID